MGAFYLRGCRRGLLRLSIAAHSILWLPPLGGSVDSACTSSVSMLGRFGLLTVQSTGVLPPMRPEPARACVYVSVP